MEKSIELNDNRLVFRSRELLDSDRATRGANLAQIYDDLGFGQLAVNQGFEVPDDRSRQHFRPSLSRGRLRGGSAGGKLRASASCSRRRCSRTSTSTRCNPVSPRPISASLTRGGPFKPGYNEFTPLFERNDVQFQATGLAGRGDPLEFEAITPTPAGRDGKDDTLGFEGIASALHGRFSISAGAFQYETDGWRPNAGIQHNIYDLFMQSAVTPDFNLQLELRHHDSELGDLLFEFDPAFFNPELARILDRDTARVGARYSPSPNSNLLLSAIYSERNEEQNNLSPGLEGFNIVTERKTYQAESQYIYEKEWFNFVAGIQYTNQDGLFELPFTEPNIAKAASLRGYTYTNVKFPKSVTWTLGGAFDEYEQASPNVGEETIVINRTSPKLGVRWDVTDNLSLRAATFDWIKPILASNQSLEPTQVSGFQPGL